MKSEELGHDMLDMPSDVVAATIDVYKIYKTGELETVALRGVSLSLREGEIVSVAGPSGSGKSTLVSILGGIIRPTAGSVYWSAHEYDISKLEPEKVTNLRRKFVSFVFQEENLLPHFTVLHNVELSAQIAGLSKTRERAKYLLERVGLKNRIRSIPGMLSSGERQRVAIAGALITSPKLVLADEPTGNIDLATSEEILELLRELNEETGTSFLIVTHSQQVASRANRILEIKDGVLMGSHAQGADIRDLDRSRILNLDKFSRLLIPPYLLDQIGSPQRFRIRIEDGEVILTPYEEGVEPILSAVVCKVCGKVIKERATICPNCGSVL